MDDEFALEGGCTCRAVRYRMTTRPLFVHCCHCRWCQRETGASFALNALIESNRVEVLQGAPEVVDTPSNSGKGQKITLARFIPVATAGDAPTQVARPKAGDAVPQPPRPSPAPIVSPATETLRRSTSVWRRPK